MLAARPGLRGTLVELPAAIARAEGELAAIARAEGELAAVADRVTMAPGSFFDPPPAGADAYVLAQVLHDWADPEATAILRRCAEAGDRVLVIDRVDPGDGNRPDIAFMARLAAGVGLRLHDVRALAFGHSVLDFRTD